MSTAERRALIYECDDEFDPCLTLDVNEYLIEEYPDLTLKQRTSVWVTCQKNENLDFSDLEAQVDDVVYELADDSWKLPESSDEDEEEDGGTADVLADCLFDYIQTEWEGMEEVEEEELAELTENIIQAIDEMVDGYFNDEEEEETE